MQLILAKDPELILHLWCGHISSNMFMYIKAEEKKEESTREYYQSKVTALFMNQQSSDSCCNDSYS